MKFNRMIIFASLLFMSGVTSMQAAQEIVHPAALVDYEAAFAAAPEGAVAIDPALAAQGFDELHNPEAVYGPQVDERGSDLWEGDTPAQRIRNMDMYSAAAAGETERVRELLAAGASANVFAPWNAQPVLFKALETGHGAVAMVLVQAGAHANVVYMDITPLMQAILMDHEDLPLIRQLIVSGADVNAEDDDQYSIDLF